MPQDRAITFGIKTPELTTADFAHSRAYVIGINAYKNGIPQLHTAVADAERFGELLSKFHGYQVQSCPRDGAPTLSNIRNLLQRMQQEVGPNDRVLFYFAGHGIALDGEDGPEGYLVPEDANREERTSFLSMVELNEAISKLPCRHFLLILDCCFAGAFRWSSTRDLSPLPSVIHRERYERYIQDPAWQVLASAAYDQKALDVLSGSTIGQRVETDRHSPFAEALFRALEGEADLIPRGKDGQPGGDGVITATELYLYLRESVETATVEQRMRQTPGLWPLKKHDKGEYILLVPGQELNLPPAPELNYSNNPYRGLQSFDEEHSRLFFGREGEIEELHKLVSSQSLTVVLGASGTGKSSLVKAGLLPNLRISATEKWLVLPAIRVGSSPLAALASLLLTDEVSANKSDGLLDDYRTNENAFANRVKKWEEANPDSSHLLLTVDQFEELITLCRDTKEKDLFIAQLANAILSSPVRFRLVLTLRTDFEPQFLDCSLKTYWMNGRYIIPPMSTDDLRRAIEGPASTRVLYLKPSGLIDLLVDEVIQTPGALPLLSFTMSELYVRYIERRGDDRCLTLADYEELGGVAGALRCRASKLHDGLDRKSQMTLKHLMLRMVSADGGNAARRRVPKSELEYASEDENIRVATVLQLLSDARLVVEGKESDNAPYVEPAHDELIRGWDKLQTWMRDEHEELLLRSLLTPAANDWLRNLKATWHANPRLTLLKRISMSEDSWLNKDETEFVERSLSKRKSILMCAVSFVALAFIAISLVALYANLKRVQSDSNAREANRQTANALWQIGVVSRDQNRSVKASFSFLQAAQLVEKTGEAIDKNHQRNLEIAAQLSTSNLVRSFPHDASCVGAHTSDSKSHLLTWSLDGEVKLWDMSKAEPLQVWKNNAEVNGAVFTRDDSRVLTWSGYIEGGDVKLWDVTKAEPLHVWNDEVGVVGAVLTRDESRILTWSRDGELKLCDVTTDIPLRVWKHKSTINGAVFTSDESRVLSWSEDGSMNLWDVTKTEPLQVWKHDSAINGALLTRDESRVLSWSGRFSPGEVKLWSIGEAEAIQVWKHDKQVEGALFTDDESRVLSWSNDGAMKMWDVRKAEPVQVWHHDSLIFGAKFTRNGAHVMSWSADCTVKIWDVTKSEPLHVWKHEHYVREAVFTRDESRVLACSSHFNHGAGEVKLWDVAEAEPIQVWKHDSVINGASFTNDESLVLTWSGKLQEGGAVKLFDVKKAEPIQVWKYDTNVNGAEFINEDSQVLTWCDDNSVKLWDVAKDKPLRVWKHEEEINGAMFTRDEQRVLAWSGNRFGNSGEVKLWDMTKLDPLQVWRHEEAVAGALLTHDETRVLSWSNGVLDGEAKLWDVTRAEPLQVWKHEREIKGAVFTRDELRVLTWGGRDVSDGEVSLLDTTTSEPLKEWKHQEAVCGAVFTRDESCLLTRGSFGTVALWDVRKVEPLREWKHESEVRGTVLTRDDSFVLSWSMDGTVSICDIMKSEPCKKWKHDDTVQGAVFTRDEKRVLSWSRGALQGEVKLWDVSKSEPLQIWKQDGVMGAMFTSDESRVLAWSTNGNLKLWDVSKREPLQIWKHEGRVEGAVFTRDESQVLSWSTDGSLKLWDVTRTEPLHVWKYGQAIKGARFTRDESRILAWSVDGTVKLWDCGLKIPALTSSERLIELNVRSASRLNSAGQLVPMKYGEWLELVRSPKYASIEKKLRASESNQHPK